MIYGIYKNARNAAWKCLIDYKITELPVKVSKIAKQANIIILKDSIVHELKNGESGKSINQRGTFYTIIRDSESSARCRFTLAHELGHIFLGHLMINTPAYRTFAIRNDNEFTANTFARDLLAPACVLHELNIQSPYDIAKLCDISLKAANYRAQRMKELEDRNAWYFHPAEKEVRKQFDDFIKSMGKFNHIM